MFRKFFRVARPRPFVATPLRLFNSEVPKDNKEKWTIYSLLGVAVAGVVYFYKDAKPALKEAKQDVKDVAVALKLIPEEVIPPKLKEAKITSSVAGDTFVDRPALKLKIEEAMSENVDYYLVVYGAKGMGKSELVQHTAIGKPSIVKLYVSNSSTKEQLISALMQELTLDGITLNMSKLQSVLTKCKEDGFTPVIIFEVERDTDIPVDALVVARNLAKALVFDLRSIIVLSEADAVLKFTNDPGREEFLFIGEMSRDEAKDLLEKQYIALTKDFNVKPAKLTEEEMSFVFDTIGTSPQTLRRLARRVYVKGWKLQTFVDEVLSTAYQDLLEFPLKKLLKALKEHPEGVSTDYFNNEKCEGINLSDPKSVGEKMKQRNCILYRIELKQYQLQSTAHKTAIKSYVPPIN